MGQGGGGGGRRRSKGRDGGGSRRFHVEAARAIDALEVRGGDLDVGGEREDRRGRDGVGCDGSCENDGGDVGRWDWLCRSRYAGERKALGGGERLCWRDGSREDTVPVDSVRERTQRRLDLGLIRIRIDARWSNDGLEIGHGDGRRGGGGVRRDGFDVAPEVRHGCRGGGRSGERDSVRSRDVFRDWRSWERG